MSCMSPWRSQPAIARAGRHPGRKPVSAPWQALVGDRRRRMYAGGCAWRWPIWPRPPTMCWRFAARGRTGAGRVALVCCALAGAPPARPDARPAGAEADPARQPGDGGFSGGAGGRPPSIPAWAQAAGKGSPSCRCSPTSCWRWRRPGFNGGVLPHTPQEIRPAR